VYFAPLVPLTRSTRYRIGGALGTEIIMCALALNKKSNLILSILSRAIVCRCEYLEV